MSAALAEAAKEPGGRRITIDLAEMTFMDFSGLGALVSGQHAATSAGVAFALRNSTRPVRRIIKITGLGPFLGLTTSGQ